MGEGGEGIEMEKVRGERIEMWEGGEGIEIEKVRGERIVT